MALSGFGVDWLPASSGRRAPSADDDERIASARLKVLADLQQLRDELRQVLEPIVAERKTVTAALNAARDTRDRLLTDLSYDNLLVRDLQRLDGQLGRAGVQLRALPAHRPGLGEAVAADRLVGVVVEHDRAGVRSLAGPELVTHELVSPLEQLEARAGGVPEHDVLPPRLTGSLVGRPFNPPSSIS